MLQNYVSELRVSSKRKRVLGDFAEITSAHGCILATKSQNAFMRALWIIAIITAWLVCTYQIWISVDKYYQYQTIVTIQIKHLTNVTFPAITICNLNPIRSSWLKNNFSKTILDEIVNTDDINLSVAGHDINDMLIDCTFQSTKCTSKNFTRWEHGTYGNCYTFLVTRQEYVGFLGPLYGLSLTLHVEDKEYLIRHSQGSGFKVEVHPAEYIPFPEDKGFTISPGILTSVGIKKKRISRMPLPYDGTDCGDLGDIIRSDSLLYYGALKIAGYNGQVNYTTQACMKSCYQKRLIQDCNCVDPSFVTRDDIYTFYTTNDNKPSACDMTLQISFECVRKSLENSTSSGFCEKLCPQSCYEQDYIPRVTTSLWPRTSYYKRVKDLWKRRFPSLETIREAHEARTNLAKLEVYYEQLNYESVVESPSQDVWDLLSSIGGTLGLYVGMSFLTLGEFAELFFRCVALPIQDSLQQLSF
uniref:Uncharacterized protein n=1 Tax=Setaria digitata TaxID=48799 RepID=A0A915PR56_9BILA